MNCKFLKCIVHIFHSVNYFECGLYLRQDQPGNKCWTPKLIYNIWCIQLPKWVHTGLRFRFITCFDYITLYRDSSYFKGHIKAEHRMSEWKYIKHWTYLPDVIRRWAIKPTTSSPRGPTENIAPTNNNSNLQGNILNTQHNIILEKTRKYETLDSKAMGSNHWTIKHNDVYFTILNIETSIWN
jgi:hypothetical protein